MIDILPSSGSVIDAANPVNWSHPSMQPGTRPTAWYLAFPGSMGGAKFRDLMSPADVSVGRHAVLWPGTTWRSSNRQGGCGSLMFNGVVDPTSASSFSLTANVSVSVWAYTSTAAANASRFLDLAQSATIGINLAKASSTSYGFDNSGGPTSGVFATVAADSWSHFCVTRAGTTYTLFVNSELAGTSGGGAPTYTRLFLGALSTTGSKWAGPLDDVQIHPRALSSAEIRELYLSSRDGYPGVLNRIPTTIAPPTGSGLLLQRRRAAA